MGTKILGETVVDGTSIQWGAIMGVLVSVIVYTFTEGVVGLIDLFGRGYRAAIDGVAWFVTSTLSIPIDKTEAGITAAWRSFETSLPEFGVLAFPVSVGGAAIASMGALVILWVILR